MAKDGTNRGGRRVTAGSKPTPMREKVVQGKDAKIIRLALNSLEGTDLEPDSDIEGADMPEPSSNLAAVQRDGNPLGADEIFRDTWRWLRSWG